MASRTGAQGERARWIDLSPAHRDSPVPFPTPRLRRPPPLVRLELLPLHCLEQSSRLLGVQLFSRFTLRRTEPPTRHRTDRGIRVSLIPPRIHVPSPVV